LATAVLEMSMAKNGGFEHMNYAMAVVGHGRYPEGVLSALKLLIGTTDGMTAFNLDETTTHEQFEQRLKNFLDENDHALVFADMTGGAPHQIVARLMLEQNRPHQYIISSVDETLRHTVTLSKDLIEILPDRMKTNSDEVPVPDIKHDDEGDGI
jgi:PTS system N-acetylgalactosamine-specific IIA component